eukprot:TRINITY_DN2955_c0_g1_i2.p1 TRINITY_DN2955_c0_g1~~TRINITY_DN2955_c0_g1_i2.p1  ORF type:complete len:149 (+),score=23.46 TRINITY_DN2955_c0_g1_i2:609-1055(+)
MSSLGGVYNEFLLKQNAEISLNVKNMYLYGFSILFYLIVMLAYNPDLFQINVLLENYTPLVYGLVLVGSFCGFSTALFLRHLNIILKEYAHSGEMLLTAFLSYYLFDTPISLSVLGSIVLVSISIYLYNHAPAQAENLPVPPQVVVKS